MSKSNSNSNSDSNDKYADLKERIAVVDGDRNELLVTFWDDAEGFHPEEAAGMTTVLVVPENSEPFKTKMCAFACDSVVNTNTKIVSIGGEEYDLPGEGMLHRLETIGGTNVYVPRDRMCRTLRVPRHGKTPPTETMGFLPEADPFENTEDN